MTPRVPRRLFAALTLLAALAAAGGSLGAQQEPAATFDGGIYFSTFNRFLDVLEDIDRYNTGYYLLSFRSEVPANETGYRTFELGAKDRKVRIKARRGYRYSPVADPTSPARQR